MGCVFFLSAGDGSSSLSDSELITERDLYVLRWSCDSPQLSESDPTPRSRETEREREREGDDTQ